MLLAGRPHGDFNIVTQRSEKFHETPDGKVTGAISHQQGDLRLPHTENLGDLDLRHATILEERIDLQSEPRLEKFLLGIGKAKICKDVSAPFG